MLIDFMLFVGIALSLMSYFSATENTFFQEYSFQFHTFSTPFFVLGVIYEDLGCEDQEVSCIRIGFIFFVIRLITYRLPAAIRDKCEKVREEHMCWWQKALRSIHLYPDHRTGEA